MTSKKLKKSGKHYDTEILDYHKDKEHDVGGLSCDLCDDMECMWEKKVDDEFTSMNNIFINLACGEDFIEKWLAGVGKLSDEEKERINYTWPPVRFYTLNTEYTASIQLYYTSLDEFIANLMKRRRNHYYRHKLRPKVEFEFIEDFMCALCAYKPNSAVMTDGPNRYNEIFLFLSHISGYIPYLLLLDERRCKELVDIFSKLPDD